MSSATTPYLVGSCFISSSYSRVSFSSVIDGRTSLAHITRQYEHVRLTLVLHFEKRVQHDGSNVFFATGP